MTQDLITILVNCACMLCNNVLLWLYIILFYPLDRVQSDLMHLTTGRLYTTVQDWLTGVRWGWCPQWMLQLASSRPWSAHRTVSEVRCERRQWDEGELCVGWTPFQQVGESYQSPGMWGRATSDGLSGKWLIIIITLGKWVHVNIYRWWNWSRCS